MEDNQGAIEQSKNPKLHNPTKHIDIAFHFVRERVNSQEILVKYCPTETMIADLLTKPLQKDRFETLPKLMGIDVIIRTF